VVAQKLYTIPWKEVAIIVQIERKSGLSEHGKPLFLVASPKSPPQGGDLRTATNQFISPVRATNTSTGQRPVENEEKRSRP